MIATAAGGLALSLLALLGFAWRVAERVREHIHPTRRRDLTLAGADRPEDLELWLKQNVWRVSSPLAMGLLIVALALFTAPFVMRLDVPPRGAVVGALVLAWFHFALSVQVCAAMVVLLAAKACKERRELSPAASIAATLLGALAPLIAPILIYAGSRFLNGAVPTAWTFLLLLFGPFILQLAALTTTVPLAQSVFIRDYPWSE